MLTVGNLKAQETNEKECCNIGEVIPLQVEILVDAHDSSILYDRKGIVSKGC